MSVAFSRGLISSSSGGGGGAAGFSATNSTTNAAADAGENDAMAAGAAANAKTSPFTTPSSSSSSAPTKSKPMKSLPLPHPPGIGATEREMEYFIRDALSSCILLERYPRCVIQVVLQIVQADGSVLGSAVNCAVLALMDAGVAMRGLPVASTCVVVDNDVMSKAVTASAAVIVEEEKDNASVGTTVWLDPTAEEESGEGHATVVLVTDMANSPSSKPSMFIRDVVDDDNDSSGGIITSMTFGSPLSLKGLLSSAEYAKQSSAAMVAFMRLAIEQKVQREMQTLWS